MSLAALTPSQSPGPGSPAVSSPLSPKHQFPKINCHVLFIDLSSDLGLVQLHGDTSPMQRNVPATQALRPAGQDRVPSTKLHTQSFPWLPPCSTEEEHGRGSPLPCSPQSLQHPTTVTPCPLEPASAPGLSAWHWREQGQGNPRCSLQHTCNVLLCPAKS